MSVDQDDTQDASRVAGADSVRIVGRSEGSKVAERKREGNAVEWRGAEYCTSDLLSLMEEAGTRIEAGTFAR